MKHSRSRRRPAAALATLVIASALAVGSSPTLATGASGEVSSVESATATRWVRDSHPSFKNPLDDHKWGRYGWGYQPVGHGAMGTYKPDNVFTRDGKLVLRTTYRNGQWSSAGVSGNPGFSAVGGKWEVRAKMPAAKGIGYAFLLMPTDGSWPPEVDIAEGRVNGRVESFYHWGTPQKQERGMSVAKVNTHKWHTYGVIFEGRTVIFTLDGKVTGRVANVPATDKRFWLGFQTGAMDPSGEAKAYETVDGGKPNSRTPASSEIQIDWVSHYHR